MHGTAIGCGPAATTAPMYVQRPGQSTVHVVIVQAPLDWSRHQARCRPQRPFGGHHDPSAYGCGGGLAPPGQPVFFLGDPGVNKLKFHPKLGRPAQQRREHSSSSRCSERGIAQHFRRLRQEYDAAALALQHEGTHRRTTRACALVERRSDRSSIALVAQTGGNGLRSHRGDCPRSAKKAAVFSDAGIPGASRSSRRGIFWNRRACHRRGRWYDVLPVALVKMASGLSWGLPPTLLPVPRGGIRFETRDTGRRRVRMRTRSGHTSARGRRQRCCRS